MAEEAVPVASPAVPPPAAPAVVAAPPPAVETPAAGAAPPAATPPVSSPEPARAEAAPEAKPEPAKPAEAAPVTEPPKAEVKPEEPKSLLADAKAPEKAPEAKPAEAKSAEAAAPEPLKYTDFTLPEGVQLDKDQLGKYTEVLGKHQVPQDAAQGLVDLYIKEMTDLQKAQRAQWDRMQDEWVREFRESEIGGNREETTLQRCAAVLDQYAAANGAERGQKLRAAMTMTGIGNNPEMIRFVNWAAGLTVESARPVAAIVPKAPQPSSKAQRRYANPAFSTGAS